jgi:SAM-dependent methyltransferase
MDLRALAQRLRRGGEPLAAIDLACGTGANLRHLAPRLGGPQRWTVVDHDARLLAALPRVLADWARPRGFACTQAGAGLRLAGPDWQAEIGLLRLDLAASLAELPLAQAGLVTASALLDLVSARWVEELIARVRPAGTALLFALSVDGRIAWEPRLDGDAAIQRLFAAHQGRDKGFGPSLGTAAAAFTAARMAAAGWRCAQIQTDWIIDAAEGPQPAGMLHTLIEGIAGAAREQSPAAAARIDAWRAERLAHLPGSCLRVGHLDLLAEASVNDAE